MLSFDVCPEMLSLYRARAYVNIAERTLFYIEVCGSTADAG